MQKLFLACMIALLSTPLLAADQDVMRYDVRLLGARIGVLTIATTQSPQSYASRSRFSTVGFVGAIRSMEADVSVQGKMASGDMRPVTYTEAIDDGSRVTDVAVRFAPGTPRLVSGDTGSKAPPADAASLNRAIDPLTGLYLLLRDQPPGLACDFVADIFDGHRLARIALNREEKRGTGLICHGSYQRLSGYTNSERRSKNAPFSIEYAPLENGYRAKIVRVDTRYGSAVIKRK